MIQLMKRIAECLRCKELPTAMNVHATYEAEPEWPPNTKNYLERGGTIEAVLRALFDRVIEESEEAGLDEFFNGPEFREMHDALPTCRNDAEWGFILGMFVDFSTPRP